MRSNFLKLALAAVTLAAIPGYATVISTYSSLAAWQAVTAGVQTIDFEDQAIGSTSATTGYTIHTVQFTDVTVNPQVVIIDTSAASFTNYGTKRAIKIQSDRSSPTAPVPYFHITLPSAVTAFGLNLFTASPHALSFNVTAAGSTSTVPTFDIAAVPNLAFFGATFDAPVTTIDILPLGTAYQGGSYLMLDNFAFGTEIEPAATPEILTMFMIGFGMVGMAYLRRIRPGE